MNRTRQTAQTPLVRGVQGHYDLLSVFYHWYWGEHIHHGYWLDGESRAEAQVNLIRQLSDRAGVSEGMRVLDVGCGVGGSSLWLAGHRGCSVTGITISPVQARMAIRKARRRGVQNVSFRVWDANDLSGLEGPFECIWVVECSEHLADKAGFFRQCHALLRPGGRLALCAWMRGPRQSQAPELLNEIYEAMLLASMLDRGEMTSLLRQAGFAETAYEDVTPFVKPTWDHCLGISRRPLFRILLPVMGPRVQRFVHSFKLMKRAYDSQAMEYGMVVSKKTS